MRRIAPTGYISLLDAVERLAGTDVPREIKKEFYSDVDFIDDAELEEKATIRMRQALVDGLLTGIYQESDGRLIEVARWIWSADAKCLGRQPKMAYERDDRFHRHGIIIDERRVDVFLNEKEFEAWRKKGAKTVPPKSARPKLPQGRPRGAVYDDQKWVGMIGKFVEQGMTPHAAATKVVRDNGDAIDKQRNDVTEESLIRRLIGRYKASLG